MKNKYISAFAIAVSFGLLVGCSNKTDDVISDNVQTQAVESSESVVETVETASQNETAETAESAESTPTTESVEVSKEDEALNEVVSNQNEVVQEQTTVEDTTAEEAVPTEQTTQPTEQTTQPTEQSTQPTEQSTSTSRIDMEHVGWCLDNDPSQLTEAEVQRLNHLFPGLFPKDPRQLTPAECKACNDAYFNRYSDDYTTGMAPTEDHEITQEEIAAAFAANGVTVTPYNPNIDTSALDGYEIVWD